MCSPLKLGYVSGGFLPNPSQTITFKIRFTKRRKKGRRRKKRGKCIKQQKKRSVTSEDCKELSDVDGDLEAVTGGEDADDEDEDAGDEQLLPLPATGVDKVKEES